LHKIVNVFTRLKKCIIKFVASAVFLANFVNWVGVGGQNKEATKAVEEVQDKQGSTSFCGIILVLNVMTTFSH